MFGPELPLMEEEVVRNLQPQPDAASQERAMDFLNQVKYSELGWQMCIDCLSSDRIQEDSVKFFCFQVLEYFCKCHYETAPVASQQKMRQFLSFWVQTQSAGNTPVYLRNKAAQIFSLVFINDYPLRWPSFFVDFIDTLSLGHLAADTYLRVLKGIHTEVVDIDVCHLPSELVRNGIIKEAMRENAVDLLVESWYQILTVYQPYYEVVRQCLEVIGEYVSWISLGLVANTRFINVLLVLMGQIPGDVREAAVDCMYALIDKGMDPMAKVELIETLMPMLGHIIEPVKDDESDFTCKLSRLLNGIGLNLIDAQKGLKSLSQVDPDQIEVVQCAIERKIPLMIKFLDNEYDEVSLCVIEFGREYIHLLKGRAMMTQPQHNNVRNILLTIARKMEYDDSYRFDHEGEDEVSFLDYRKLLKIFFDNVAGLNRDMVLEFTHKHLINKLQEWQSCLFQELEVAMSLMYYIGEVLGPAVLGDQFVCSENQTGNVSVLQQMMTTLVTSEISYHSHPMIIILYLETVLRYHKFFIAEPQHLPTVLITFLDQRGMRNDSCKVRSRTAYLFSRFVKTLKEHMLPYTDHVLLPLQEMLVLATPTEGSIVSRDDQLFLYETAAVLIISSSYAPHEKSRAFATLLTPVLNKFRALVVELKEEPIGARAQQVADYLRHAMAVTSRTSKAFINNQCLKSNDCTQVFLDTMQVFLTCLEEVETSCTIVTFTLQSALCQFLHRMVVCLEDEVLPFIPKASAGLMKNCNIQSLQEYLPLMIQIISKFKRDVVPFLRDMFRPIVSAVFLCLSAPIAADDEHTVRDRKALRRNYFTFITSIVTSDLIDILRAHPDNAFVEQVMMSVIQGAVDYPDPCAQKTCFVILRHLVNIWGQSDNEPEGFTLFLYKEIVPACFLAPSKATFDMYDGQAMAALSEIAICMKTIYLQRGDEYLNFLRNEFLPSLHLNPEAINCYCLEVTKDIKSFKAYLKTFVQDAKA